MKTQIYKKKLIIAQHIKTQRNSFKNLKILLKRKSDILWLAYYQGQIFQKFKKQFVNIDFKFSVSKSTITFKIALSKLKDYYPRIKNSSLFLHYFKKHLKTIGEICKKNASEFK